MKPLPPTLPVRSSTSTYLQLGSLLPPPKPLGPLPFRPLLLSSNLISELYPPSLFLHILMQILPKLASIPFRLSPPWFPMVAQSQGCEFSRPIDHQIRRKLWTFQLYPFTFFVDLYFSCLWGLFLCSYLVADSGLDQPRFKRYYDSLFAMVMTMEGQVCYCIGKRDCQGSLWNLGFSFTNLSCF